MRKQDLPKGKTAVIFSGLLRLADVNSSELKKITSKYDTFVCTSRDDEHLLAHMGQIKGACFIEDDPTQKILEATLMRLNHGSKFLQWQKLFMATQMLIDSEIRNSKRYDAVFKLRTDIDYSQFVGLPEGPYPADTLYMQSDQLFGGERDAFAKVSNFIEPAIGYYFNNFGYQRLNLENIDECDFSAARFLWLRLPKKVFRYPHSEAAIFRKLSSHKKEISAIGDRESWVYCKRGLQWLNIKFPSEPAFLHFVLNKGLVVKSFSATWLSLRHDRGKKKWGLVPWLKRLAK